ncbi:hypothetical protein ACIBJI_39975 [Nocardia sp. NPDC050408]|uniref:hypothetical protein n=1 Tax=Nocardia sp. NPDC050408 TaxID=3364319 RepID=UPI0037887AE4
MSLVFFVLAVGSALVPPARGLTWLLLILSAGVFTSTRDDFGDHRSKFNEELESTRDHVSDLAEYAKCAYKGLLVIQPSTYVRWFAHREWTSDEAEAEAQNRRIGQWLEIYMIITTVLLMVLLWASTVPGWRWFAAVFAAIRLLEIYTVSAELMLGRLKVSVGGAMVSIAIYVVQSVLIFALFASMVGCQGFTNGNDIAPHPSEIPDYLYLIWNSMATLGNSYSAVTTSARLVIAGSNVTAILIFSVLLGYVVGRLRPKGLEPANP